MSKNSDMGYHFYMVECDKTGAIIDGAVEKDLESAFPGLLYSKAVGIDKIGAPKNIYTEQYSDSNRLRAYVPNTITNQATTIVFTFIFTGDNRREVYYNFLEYIRNGYKRYRDTARNRYFCFFVNSEIAPAEERFYGDKPYLSLDVTVQNIFGRTYEYTES